jgi:hypothetical protein
MSLLPDDKPITFFRGETELSYKEISKEIGLFINDECFITIDKIMEDKNNNEDISKIICRFLLCASGITRFLSSNLHGVVETRVRLLPVVMNDIIIDNPLEF